MRHFRTEFSWDGHPVDKPASIWLSRVGRTVQIDVRARFHHSGSPVGPPGPSDGLWEYEAVEVFICSAGDPPHYTEIELGPHGHHLVLQLEGVRNVIRRELPLQFKAEIVGDHWVGTATIADDFLPVPGSRGWRVNATAVHGPPQSRRFETAAKLTATKPDFHRPHEFIEGVFLG